MRLIMKTYGPVLFLLLLLAAGPAAAQQEPSKGHYTFATVLDGDTVPLIRIREVNIYASGMLLSPKEISNNKRLIRNVRLMLPYAQEGRRRLDALEVEIANLPKKERKASLEEAYEECSQGQQATIEAMAKYLGVTERCIRDRLREFNDLYDYSGQFVVKKQTTEKGK